MTRNQKIAIAVGSGLVGAYAVIFVYQRIQRAKADANVTNSTDALKILREKKMNNSSSTEPTFSAEDTIPQVASPDESMIQDSTSVSDVNLSDLQYWDTISGMGDYNNYYV